MTTRDDSASVFEGLRSGFFEADLPAPDDNDSNIQGVAMEVGLAEASYLVLGLCDGSASLYLSTGGGSIGGQGHPHINAAAKELVRTAQRYKTHFQPTTEFPIPGPGYVRFSLRTSDGVLAFELEEAQLTSQEHELTPLYAAAHTIISGFRILEERGPPDEKMYLNCLLTALARGSATKPVKLTNNAPPPDPATLTDDPTDREWISGIGFDFERLATTEIIQALLGLAKFPLFGLSRTGRIEAQLAAHDGETLTDAAFEIRRGKDEIEIRRA